MKLTIVAATGGVGRELLTQALAAGHDVTAVARDPGKLPADVHETGKARVVAADLATVSPATVGAAALESAVAGADAVVSGLGPKATSDTGIAAQGTRAIVAAMQATGVWRIVAVSAAPVGTVASARRPDPPRHDPGDGFLMRHLAGPLVKAMIPKLYADLAQMEDVLARSGLDWTVVRPPRLTNGPLTGAYRIAAGQNVRGGWLISRANVAHLMLKALGEPETIGQVIGIAR